LAIKRITNIGINRSPNLSRTWAKIKVCCVIKFSSIDISRYRLNDFNIKIFDYWIRKIKVGYSDCKHKSRALGSKYRRVRFLVEGSGRGDDRPVYRFKKRIGKDDQEKYFDSKRTQPSVGRSIFCILPVS
jgi:hypothetical protein